MSEIAVNVIDASRSIHGKMHGSRFDFLVAALSVDPETIEELQAGLRRYLGHNEVAHFFDCFRRGISEEPWDAGVAVIDIPARIIAYDSTYSSPGREGDVLLPIQDKEIWLYYELTEDWLVTDMMTWRGLAERRRAERKPLFDARAVLYGKVTEFIARESLALAETMPTTIVNKSGESDAEPADREVTAIHARWLETAREDLFGQSPREVLLERKRHIDIDLQWRANQWSFVGGCPPLLSRDSAAYRFGGFGTNEWVLYYDLVRHLLGIAWENIAAARPPAQELAELLDKERERWLNTVDPDLKGRTPAQVIDSERRRQPFALSGKEAMIDCDCPLCQMAADSFGPMFWYLDGSEMDDDFVYTSYSRREDWEAEQRRWDERNREFTERERRRKELEGQPVWSSSHAAPIEDDTLVEVILFGIGANLGELVQCLKQLPDGQAWIDRLNREFGNLREAIATPELLEAVAVRFIDGLRGIGDKWLELEVKCKSLEERVNAICTRLTGKPAGGDIPF